MSDIEDKLHKVVIDFSPEAYKSLTKMRERAGAVFNAEVFRTALRLYDWYLEHKEKGHKILVDRNDGKIVEIELEI